MRTVISLIAIIVGCTTQVAADCRVTEFADHYEAVCIGDGVGSQIEGGRSLQVEPASSALNTPPEAQAAAPQQIVRNDLAKLHWATWLKNGH